MASKHHFKFENSWLLEEGLDAIVMESWARASSGDILDKLYDCSQDLDRWGRSLKVRFTRDISKCKKEIEQLLYNHDPGDIVRLGAAKHKQVFFLCKRSIFGVKGQRCIGSRMGI